MKPIPGFGLGKYAPKWPWASTLRPAWQGSTVTCGVLPTEPGLEWRMWHFCLWVLSLSPFPGGAPPSPDLTSRAPQPLDFTRLMQAEPKEGDLRVLLAVPWNAPESCSMFHSWGLPGALGIYSQSSIIFMSLEHIFSHCAGFSGVVPMVQWHLSLTPLHTDFLVENWREHSELPVSHSWVSLRISCLFQMVSSNHFPKVKRDESHPMTFVSYTDQYPLVVSLEASNSYSTSHSHCDSR